MPLFADIVLAAHLSFVMFVVCGAALIWLGVARGWRWVRNRKFRIAHLAAISFVAVEALLGWACPLTLLEDWLRSGNSTPTGFVQRGLQAVLYWDFPAYVFTLAYVLFAGLVALSYFAFPPTQPRRA